MTFYGTRPRFSMSSGLCLLSTHSIRISWLHNRTRVASNYRDLLFRNGMAVPAARSARLICSNILRYCSWRLRKTASMGQCLWLLFLSKVGKTRCAGLELNPHCAMKSDCGDAEVCRAFLTLLVHRDYFPSSHAATSSTNCVKSGVMGSFASVVTVEASAEDGGKVVSVGGRRCCHIRSMAKTMKRTTACGARQQ